MSSKSSETDLSRKHWLRVLALEAVVKAALDGPPNLEVHVVFPVFDYYREDDSLNCPRAEGVVFKTKDGRLVTVANVPNSEESHAITGTVLNVLLNIDEYRATDGERTLPFTVHGIPISADKTDLLDLVKFALEVVERFHC